MKEKNEEVFPAEKKISRKEAIKKTGLIAASTATMMILMKSQKAQASSPARERNRNQNQQQDCTQQTSGGIWSNNDDD